MSLKTLMHPIPIPMYLYWYDTRVARLASIVPENKYAPGTDVPLLV